MRTRVKICGMTRVEDVKAAAQAGADAIGIVFYPPSPRVLSLDWARQLAGEVPPFVSTVALFVNPTAAEVYSVLERVKPAMLQFHGEEAPVFCAQFGVPYIKACRVKPGVDLLEYLRVSRCGRLDADATSRPTAGSTFVSPDPGGRRRPVLSGGLTPGTWARRPPRAPWAVDVRAEESRRASRTRQDGRFIRGSACRCMTCPTRVDISVPTAACSLPRH
jgi:phosphoribosylanthranilate isomerase